MYRDVLGVNLKRNWNKKQNLKKPIICICLGDALDAGGEHRLWNDGGTLSWQDCTTVYKFSFENGK